MALSVRGFCTALLVVLVSTIVVTVSFASRANAAAPTLTINELMYNSASDIDGDEFIELYNTTGAPLDISGWCFTEGVSGCFAPTTIVPTGGYVLAGSDAAQFNTTYGKSLDLIYTGKLSNGGEQIVLKDASNNTVIDMTYDDKAPWPTAADGGGPSMELKDALLDPTIPTNWASSLSNGGTPGGLNSVANTDIPSITDTTNPDFPDPSTNMPVTATTENTSSATITYKVNFDADVTASMFDDGTNGDTTPNDGIFSFNIPGQSAGDLIRYKITATNATTSVTNPPNGDGMNYRSFIVEDGQTATLPIVRWYIEDDDFEDMTVTYVNDKVYFDAVIAIGDKVYDNTKVRLKGESSRSYPKKKFKFELPTGYTVQPETFEHAVDEFSLNVYFLNFTDLQEKLAWDVFGEFGLPQLQNTNTRVQKNNGANPSEFYGHYLLIETYDKTWRERNGYEEGALYKESFDKKTREDEDSSDIADFRNNLLTLEGEELKAYLEDNVNIPNIVNYHAVSTVIGHQDWNYYHNIYQYRDTEGTRRWEVLPWDLDNAISTPVLEGVNFDTSPDRLDPLSTGEPSQNVSRVIENALFQFPEYREMYYRRLATVYDELYKKGKLINLYESLYDKSSATINEDLAFWKDDKEALYAQFFPNGLPYTFPSDFPLEVDEGDILSGNVSASVMDTLFHYGNGRQISFMDSFRSQGYFPQPQASKPRITITELMYNPPGGSDHEYLELYNPNNYAVDISGWKIDGIGLTIPQGTVLPSNGYGLVVKNDVAFRQHYGGGKFIISEYDGKLANEGETISLLRTDNSLASRVSYQPGTNGWPGSPNGQGYSLELIRANANPELVACWAPSAGLNGTPGNTNSPNQAWVDQYGNDCTDFEDIESTVTLAKTGQSNQFFITVASSLVSFGAFLTIFKQSRYSHR